MVPPSSCGRKLVLRQSVPDMAPRISKAFSKSPLTLEKKSFLPNEPKEEIKNSRKISPDMNSRDDIHHSLGSFVFVENSGNNNIKNSIYSPFGFNTSIYKKFDAQFKYDVSFVGGYSPYRKWLVELLRKKGISVKVFGRKWDKMGTWVDQNEMVNIFNNLKSFGQTKNNEKLLASLTLPF